MAEATADTTVELPPAAGEEAAPRKHEGPFHPSAGGWAARYLVGGGLVVFIFVLPLLVEFTYQADLISRAGIYACVALSMNILVGYLGQLSLGHQAFFGIGAFTSAGITFKFFTEPAQQAALTSLTADPTAQAAGAPIGLFVVGLLAATLTGALTALILGSIALRVRGLYLAIVTLAYGLLAEVSIFNIGFLSAGVPADKPVGFTSPKAYAYLVLGVLALLYLIDVRLLKSKAGRAIQAIRDDEKVAASFGINVTNYKLLAFVLSGSFAGLAGGLFAHAVGNVDAVEFNLRLALTFVLMTVVGGLGNRVGVLIGAVMFAVLDNILAIVIGAANSVLELTGTTFHVPEPNPILVPVIGAALLVLTLIQFPGGIGQQISPIQQWVRGNRFNPHLMKENSGPKGGGMVGRP